MTSDFDSRRGVICAGNAAVACSQPLASEAGMQILRKGGNAADAAVAVAAALNVTQPTSTGLGGDAFVLYYDAMSGLVRAINGSGRCPAALTLAKANADGFDENNPFPQQHGHAVTVPGAAAAWVDTVTTFGSGQLTLTEILQPAVLLATNGYPLSQTTGDHWKRSEHLFTDPRNTHGVDLLVDGVRAPKWGERFTNPRLADTFRSLGAGGKAGFYSGRIAQAIVDAVGAFGGVMTVEDLANHTTTFDQPIFTDYKGVRLWECPPNGQGIIALMMLNLLKGFDLKAMGHNSVAYLHTLIEATRLSFVDAGQYVADPSVVPVPVEGMLSAAYADARRALIDPNKAMATPEPGNPWDYKTGTDTVYFSVVDALGNACSFINSNYQGFGTGIVPEGCGITLQNRGANFSLVPGHPNVIAPNKRPYQTIIPAMVTETDTAKLLCSYGVMGGFMQPQGHVQVLLNMLEFGMHPQQALDAARYYVQSSTTNGPWGNISFEDGISAETIAALGAMGHEVVGPVIGVSARGNFGWGQAITRGAWWKDATNNDIVDDPTILWVGVDPRSDGNAFVY